MPLPSEAKLALSVVDLLMAVSMEFAEKRRKAFRIERRPRVGSTLRPGKDTPLWSALVEEVRPHLLKHGSQAALARLLGLDRQTIHAYFVARTRMPDAERTLQILTWLIATRQGRPPS